MAKQLNSVSLMFTADTSQARNAIAGLVNDLNKLSGSAIKSQDLPLTKQMMEAQVAAKQLAATLENSFNIDTGKLDLTKFTQQLNSSGMTLSQYGAKLSALGTEGDKAFLKIAQSIAKTQTPLKQTNGLLKEFGVTLRNTVRWQISSSVLHGFMGALQSAYGYAQDLNESLNNIRIVTGANTEQMADFAAQANKAAQALSTTTTRYTNASLIYYQQGLTDEEVAQRTEVTIKMANAAGASAETVSEQLTAVWNNFYDGSKSLEYYADVMTALGAATASSSDEISEGLNKFAAVASSVGLSYEYATAALATITSNTRESADVVGNSLKTLFARIQGLQLGETLDDGTTLNKYSEALNKVGISIYTTDGSLKRMDDTLDEMAEKWGTLTKAQQVALAQTVAGVRQYNQLIALMENWNAGDSDSMVANLETAYGSSGALEEQADIYAESWEASRDRVTAAAEEIYQSLIDEDFFISLNDTFTTLLHGISAVVDSLGGVKGVISGVGIILTSVFGELLTSSINNGLSNFKIFTGVAKNEMEQLKKEAYEAAMKMTEGFDDVQGVKTLRESLASTYSLQKQLTEAVKGMSSEQKAAAENAVKLAEEYAQIAVEAGRAADEAERLAMETTKKARKKYQQNSTNVQDATDTGLNQIDEDLLKSARKVATNSIDVIGEEADAYTNLTNRINQYSEARKRILELEDKSSDPAVSEEEQKAAKRDLEQAKKEKSQAGDALTNAMIRVNTEVQNATNSLDKFYTSLPTDEVVGNFVTAQEAINKLQTEIYSANESGENKDFSDEIVAIGESAKEAGVPIKDLTAAINKYEQAQDAVDKADKKVTSAENSLKAAQGQKKGKKIAIEKAEKTLEEAKKVQAEAQKIASASASELETAFKQVSVSSADAAKAVAEKAKQASGYTGELTEDMIESAGAAHESAKAQRTAGNASKVLADETAKASAKLKTQTLVYQSLGSAMTGTIQTISAGLTSINALKSITDTLNNTELTTFEKTSQIVMSLSMAIPALVTGFKNLGNIWAFVISKQEEGLSVQLANLLGVEKIIDANGYYVISEEGKIIASNVSKETAEKEREEYEKLTNAKSRATIMTTYETKEIWKKIAAQIWEHRYTLMVVAALAALSVAIYAAVKAYNADAEAAKESAAQVQVLTERYEEAKNAAEELKTTISDWNDAIEAFSELEAGAEGYAEALDNANEKARELIETYGLWDSYDFDNGIITIKPEALEDVQAAADNAANQARVQMYQGEIYSNQASIRSETTNLQRQTKAFNTGAFVNIASEYGSYAIPEYRKLTDAEVQAVAQVATDLKESLGGVTPTASQLIDKLNELGANSGLGSDALDNLSSIIDDKTITGFLSLGESLSETEKANQYYTKQILGMAIEEEYGDKITKMATDDEGNIDENRYNQILAIFTNQAAAMEEQKDAKYSEVENEVRKIASTSSLNAFLDKYENDADGNARNLINEVLGGNYDGEINNDEELGLMYAQMMSGIDKSELTYVWGNGVGTVKNAEGETIVNGVSDEVMRREIAKQVAMADITSQYTGLSEEESTKLETALNNIMAGGTKTAEKYGVDFSTAILDAMSNENYDSLDFSGLFSELDPEEMAELSGLDETGILSMLGIKRDDLVDAGYDVDNFVSAFSDALDKWTYELDTSGIEEKAATLQDIIDDLETGAIVEEDTILTLQELGINIDDYFAKMADGSYKLVGIAEDLVNILKGEIQQDYIDKILEAKSAQVVAANAINEKYAGTAVGNKWMDTSVTDIDGMGSNTQKLYQARRDYINEAGGASAFGFTEEQAALLEKDSWTWEEMQDINAMLETATQSASVLQEQLFSTATTLSELEGLKGQLNAAGVEVSDNAYAEGLINLASQYDNCTEEILKYQEALLTGSKAEIQAAQSALEAAIEAGELAEKYDLNAEELEDYSKRLKDLHKDSNLSTRDATKLATANMRLDRGVSNLNDNLDDYKKALKASNKGSAEWSNTLSDLKTDLADMLNVADGSMLSDQFAEDTLASEDLKLALDGDADAILRLRMAAADDIIANLDVDDSALAEVNSDWEYLKANLANDIAAGGINDEKMVAAFNDMIAKGNMTKDEIEAALAGLNVSANVKTNYISQKQQVPLTVTETSWLPSGTMTVPVPDGNGGTNDETYTSMRRVTKTYDAGTSEADVVVPQYSIEGTEGEGSITSSFTQLPAPTVSKSVTTSGKNSGSGGGSTTKTSSKRQKKSDVVERYKEINDQIDDTEKKLDDASKAADRLWGSARLKQMQKVSNALQEEIDLLKEKKEEAENYLVEDRNTLDEAAADAGVSFTYDENGNITNYESEMTKLYNDREALLDSFGDEIDEDEQEELDAFDERLDALTDAIDQYDETRETIEDLDDDLTDKVYTWQDNNAEMLSYKLELKLEINDNDLREIEYYLGKMEDDFYSMAEAAALMVGNLNGNGNLGDGGQLGTYFSNLSAYSQQYNDLVAAYNTFDEDGNRSISDEAYASGLQEIYDGLYENLELIEEVDDAMMDYYGDTIAAAGEELAKYTDQMEHQTSVLEHYNSLMELMGKSNDYKKMDIILQGQSKTIQNQAKVAKETMDLYKNQADEKWAKYQAALAAGDEAAAELYKKEYEAALSAANEAEEEYLSKTEEYVESLKAILENSLSDFAQELENSLTGGTSFDQINSQLERAASLQEEYLTTTNQIYETNKLMRAAQQEIDKTSNTVAKNRLKQFINETDALQNQAKLSNYELEIQQAKYDLLLAEIALEEAQNAKSTVRLQRDSEGNFGYVYTADSSAISEAQQQLEDAQNALYNIGLEGANSYTEKYQQTLSEMYDTLTDLQQQYLNGAFESEEEYNNAVTAAKEYYYEKLEQYSSLHAIALTTDSRIIEDAWSSQFSTMVYSTETWKDKVDEYVDNAAQAFRDWAAEMETIEEELGLDDIEGAVSKIEEASDDLLTTLTKKDGVLDSLEKELEDVSAVTGAYATQRTTIQGLTEDYKDLAGAVKDTLTAMGKVDEEDSTNPDGTTNPEDATTDPDDTTNPDNTTRAYDTKTKRGVALAIWNGNYGWGNNPGRSTKLKEKGFDPQEIQGLVDNTDPSGGWGRRYGITDLSKYSYSSFDTGGYTGEWGAYGKMAMLHEKELVLNEHDTDNFLATMEIMERILQTLDLQTINSQIGGILSSPSLGNTGNQVIEQHIEIEASFPAATDRTEIEEAFKSMANLASQYANRK